MINKCLKFILIVSGILLLIARALPGALTVWQPFAVLSRFGHGATILFGIFAITAFLIAIVQKRKQTTEIGARDTLILHDLTLEQATELLTNSPNSKFFNAASKIASCRGFYDCWLRSPGICALWDGTENLGRDIAQSNTLIIISKSIYGGFSRETKAALDRSIPFALPFFQLRNKEVHHQVRYNLSGVMRVYIYEADTLSGAEKDSIRDVAKAVAVNMGRSDCETVFVRDATELSEVLS